MWRGVYCKRWKLLIRMDTMPTNKTLMFLAADVAVSIYAKAEASEATWQRNPTGSY